MESYFSTKSVKEPSTEEDVHNGYYWLLGRAPENAQVVADHCGKTSREVLRQTLISSDEFASVFDGVSARQTRESLASASDIALFHKYARPGAPRDGFIIDFLGSVTSVNYALPTRDMGGTVEDVPEKGNFHSSEVEWLGLVRAVDEAGESFTMVEMGAGWAPWLVAGGTAARTRGISEITLLGVEADEGHVGFIHDHMHNNDFPKTQYDVLFGAVSGEDGTMRFPKIDSVEDWGAAAVAEVNDEGTDYRGKSYEFVEVPALRPRSVLERFETVDLCHIDIQGAERAAIRADIETFNQKVRRVVVGTHSRAIEGELFEIFSQNGWRLEAEEACHFDLPGEDRTEIDEANTHKDGTQVWRNTRF